MLPTSSLRSFSSGSIEGSELLYGAAKYFLAEAQRYQSDASWDEHSSDARRYYSLLCLIKGGTPAHYQRLVPVDALPESRATRCRNEYIQAVNSWNSLLRPFSNVRGGRTFNN